MAAGISVLNVDASNDAACALLAQLHRRAFEPQGDAVWETSAFKQLLASPGVRADIFQQQDLPYGFCLYRVVAGEAELISVAVDPSYQKQGLASHIMTYLLQNLSDSGALDLFLEVRKDNYAAISLYQRFGLKQIGIRKGYYKKSDGQLVDAVVLSCEVS